MLFDWCFKKILSTFHWLLRVSYLGNTGKENCYDAFVALHVTQCSDKQIRFKERQYFIVWLDFWVLRSMKQQDTLIQCRHYGLYSPIFLCIISPFLWLISFQLLNSWLTTFLYCREKSVEKNPKAQIQS